MYLNDFGSMRIVKFTVYLEAILSMLYVCDVVMKLG